QTSRRAGSDLPGSPPGPSPPGASTSSSKVSRGRGRHALDCMLHVKESSILPIRARTGHGSGRPGDVDAKHHGTAAAGPAAVPPGRGYDGPSPRLWTTYQASFAGKNSSIKVR